jgi:formylmethanofuran dehydrogenase subunit E
MTALMRGLASVRGEAVRSMGDIKMLTCDRCGEMCIVRVDNGLRSICPDCYEEVFCQGKSSVRVKKVVA